MFTEVLGNVPFVKQRTECGAVQTEGKGTADLQHYSTFLVDVSCSSLHQSFLSYDNY